MSIFTSIVSRPELYLDPGSGSIIIQLILGALLGVGVAIRVFWKNIKDFFSKGKKTARESLDPTEVVGEKPEGLK